KVYPNPTNQFLYLELPRENENLQIQVIDKNGKLVKNEILNHSIIDVSDLADGMYLLQIQSENQIHTIPFLKQTSN
ncbi:MAG: T9SS type A sorting domain-containing protein, partial [Bacteroidia bacterium]|nr:T9SS type A sorting domain-containing protein [Bacteroidia bacterium]